MIRLGITGFPLGHTKSPAIHRDFFRRAKLKGSYEVFPFDPAGGKRAFFDFLDEKAAAGLRGLNVTIPLKEWAFSYAESRGKGACHGFAGRCASLVKAANTIVFDRAGARCANTDSAGLWDELGDWLAPTALGSVDLVVVGTGGAARGVIAAVLARHPATRGVKGAFVWGRDKRAAAALTKSLKRPGFGRAKAVLVVWCLPPLSRGEAAAVYSAIEARVAGRRVWLYDLNYGKRADATMGLTARTRWRAGFGMLKRQALASFELWTRR